jgi:glycosyltransferase involved in cell wall biosynthesis
MTVEQLLRPTPGGIGTYTDQLRIAYTRAYGKPTLISSRGTGLNVDSVARQSSWQNRVDQVVHGVTTRLWERRLRRPKQLVGLDVLHATSFHFPDPGPNGPQLSVFVHDLAWKRHPNFFPERGRSFHDRNLKRSIDLAQWLLVPSAQTKDDLMELAGVDPQRITVVGEGADHLPTPSVRRTPKSPYLLSVSTQEPRKNLDGLLRAYEMLRSKVGAECPRLLIVGPKGWERDTPTKDAPRSNAGVTFVGAVSTQQLADLYVDALAFAYVPHFEGFGLPPLEAMFHSVPVVASNQVPSVAPSATPNVAERPNVTEGIDAPALLVEADQPESIAGALFQLVNDPEVRARYAENGNLFAKRFTWAEVAVRHHETWFSETAP